MEVGEEYIHYEGYERIVKYRTQEEVDDYNRQVIEQEKQEKLQLELANATLKKKLDQQDDVLTFVLSTVGII